MKFSWEWLQDHIKLDLSPQEASDLLSLRGMTVDEVIKVGDDYVLDIDVTTNRPDAMNIRGIARELSAITGVGLESLKDNYPETKKYSGEFCSIVIEDSESCHRFGAKIIKNVKEWSPSGLDETAVGKCRTSQYQPSGGYY